MNMKKLPVNVSIVKQRTKMLLCAVLLALAAVTACKSEKPIVVEGYTDLGLRSGTLWKNVNEGTFNFDSAYSMYGENLPTKEQMKELVDKCTWRWNGSGYTITGPNGNSIILPAEYEGCIPPEGCGAYWVRDAVYESNAWRIEFDESGVYHNPELRENIYGGCVWYEGFHTYHYSVRLVKSKQ